MGQRLQGIGLIRRLRFAIALLAAEQNATKLGHADNRRYDTGTSNIVRHEAR